MVEIDDDEDVIFEGSPLHSYLLQNGEIPLKLTGRNVVQKKSFESNKLPPVLSVGTEQLNKTGYLNIEADLAKLLLDKNCILVEEDKNLIQNLSSHRGDDNKFYFESLIQLESLGFFVSSFLAASTRIFYNSSSNVKICSSVVAGFSLFGMSLLLFKAKEKYVYMARFNELINEMISFRKELRNALFVYRRTGENSTSVAACAHRSAVQVIVLYRRAVDELCQWIPFIDVVAEDKAVYMAFLPLDAFNINSDIDYPKKLVDVCDVLLCQQSEYLRRLFLSYCDRFRVAVQQPCNPTNLIQIQIQNLISSICEVRTKLATVLEYNMAMRLNNLDIKENDKKVRTRSVLAANNVVPMIKNIYNSSFKVGQCLQKSLQQVNELEQRMFDSFVIEEELRALKYPDWLEELENICVQLRETSVILDGAIFDLAVLIGRSKQRCSVVVDKKIIEERPKDVVNVIQPYVVMDEVFEAMACDTSKGESNDSLELDDEKYPLKLKVAKYTKRMMKELRSVLAVKAKEWEQREIKAAQLKEKEN